MKKLIAMSAAAFAATVFAGELVEGTEGFENGALPTNAWKGTGGTITEYGAGEAPTNGGTKYLKVETEEGPLLRTATDATQWGDEQFDKTIKLGSAVVDALVQFTATDTAPELETGAKFALWLRENSDQTTTLMVTCGVVNEEGEVYKSISVPLITAEPIVAGSWHRVQIKPILDERLAGEGEAGQGCFMVAIDGTVATVADKTVLFEGGIEEEILTGANAALVADGKLFPSILPYNDETAGTMESVGFNGTGALDNVMLATAFAEGEDPFEQQEPATTYALTLPTVTGATAAVTVGGETVADLTKIAAGTEVTVTWTAAEGYVITDGATEVITMTEAKTATEPTVKALYAVTVTAAANTTIASVTVNGATVEAAPTSAIEGTVIAVTFAADTGYTLAGEATVTVTVRTAAVTISGPAATKNEVYPSYVPTAMQGAYKKWADTYGIELGEDSSEEYKEAFMLNCAPADVDTEKDAFKVSITIGADGTPVVTPPVGKVYNGTITIVGSETLKGEYSAAKVADKTAKFFKAILSL